MPERAVVGAAVADQVDQRAPQLDVRTRGAEEKWPRMPHMLNCEI